MSKGAIIFFVVVFVLLGSIFWLVSRPTEDCFVDNKIFSVTLAQETDGSFFLGTGSVDEDHYYYFYQEAKGGLQGKILSKSLAEHTSIKETDSMDPVHREFGSKLKGCKDCSCKVYDWGDSTLFVPKNAIQLKFNVNPADIH